MRGKMNGEEMRGKMNGEERSGVEWNGEEEIGEEIGEERRGEDSSPGDAHPCEEREERVEERAFSRRFNTDAGRGCRHNDRTLAGGGCRHHPCLLRGLGQPELVRSHRLQLQPMWRIPTAAVS